MHAFSLIIVKIMNMMKKYNHLGIFLLFFVIGGVVFSQLLITQSQAATLSTAKDVISDSRPGSTALHTFTFTTPSSTEIKTIDFLYCTTASGDCTAPTGMILAASPTLGTVSGIGGTGYTASSTSANCTGTGNSNCTLTVTVGTPATQTVTPVAVPFATGVTNPTTPNTSTFVRITTKNASAEAIDTNTVAFAVLTSTSVAMTASVDPTFSFSLIAVDTASPVNTATTNITTTASTIPFGTLTSGSTKIGAIDTRVVTNAAAGYTITIAAAANPPLADGLNNIDVFTAVNATPAVWSSPAGSAASVNTGFIGYTTEEAALGTGTVDRFTADGPKWAGLTTTAGEVVFSQVGGDARTKRVGFQAEVNALQPSGSYTGTVILVATPTY